jgi:hypothetical protein
METWPSRGDRHMVDSNVQILGHLLEHFKNMQLD